MLEAGVARSVITVPDMIVQAYGIPTAPTPDMGDLVVNRSLELLEMLESN
jgi:hypothetical protein